MRNSPARAHFQRTLAAARVAEDPGANRADATAYELMLAKLAEDRRRLHEIQSIERKIELKARLLPDYAAWVDGALAGGHGVQDDVLMTVMVWRIDVGDLAGALDIARHALAHRLAMPDQYKRSTACLIAEEFADQALRREAIDADLTGWLCQAEQLVAGEDMPDEVRAKLQKAIGYGLAGTGAKAEALDYLKRALVLHEKVGVKKDIERLEREIKNAGGAPAKAGGGA